jgi:hypothetical protein
MKSYLQTMSPDERRAYRRWQAGWVGIYLTIGIVIAIIGGVLSGPRDVEMVQAAPAGRQGR